MPYQGNENVAINTFSSWKFFYVQNSASAKDLTAIMFQILLPFCKDHDDDDDHESAGGGHWLLVKSAKSSQRWSFNLVHIVARSLGNQKKWEKHFERGRNYQNTKSQYDPPHIWMPTSEVSLLVMIPFASQQLLIQHGVLWRHVWTSKAQLFIFFQPCQSPWHGCNTLSPAVPKRYPIPYPNPKYFAISDRSVPDLF